MKVTYDKKFHLMYIQLTGSKTAATKRIAPDINLDFDAEGRLVGIELLEGSYIDDPAKFEFEDITDQRYEASAIDQSAP